MIERFASLALVGIAFWAPASRNVHAACAVEDVDFITAGGGCLDTATGIVWSSDVLPVTGRTALFYSDVDSVCYAFGNGRDTDGDGVVDLFFPEAQGYSDWRAPTVREVLTALDDGLAAHLDYQYDAGAQAVDDLYRWTQCTNRLSGHFFAGYAIRHADGDILFQQSISGPEGLVCVRGAAANLAQDCPDKKGNLPSEDGGNGGGKGNGKGKNAMLPRAGIGTLLMLPALIMGGLGYFTRRVYHAC